jgi:hypothetical protein
MKDIAEIEDTKGVIRIRKSMTDRKHNGQRRKSTNDKRRSSRHYTEN